MKKIIIMILYWYGSVSFAIDKRDIPHIFVSPQGNVMNYAGSYRVSNEVVIRYYFDPSIDRLAVQDGLNSYSVGPIIRVELRESLLQWVNAASHQFRVEEVDRADRANLFIYGLMTWDFPINPPPVMVTFPPFISSPPNFPRVTGAGAVYIVNNGLQRHLDNFLDSRNPFSIRFRAYTGINNVHDYLRYSTFLTIMHESGHALGLAHPGGEGVWLGGYTIRPIAERLPSPIVPGTQIMLAGDIDYLEGRYHQLGRPVQREDITISIQESWLMQYLWSQRNRLVHCLAPSRWARVESVSSPERAV